jgi:hypothetical protein
VTALGDLHELFAASTGAAAGLIGLLFVAISVAPEKIFGAAAVAERRSDAERAFTALGNVFFVSLAALIPQTALVVIAVIAVFAMLQTVRTAIAIVRRYPGRVQWRNLGAISFCIYGLELIVALGIGQGGAAVKLVYIVLGLYAYALGTSWGLLGARSAEL